MLNASLARPVKGINGSSQLEEHSAQLAAGYVGMLIELYSSPYTNERIALLSQSYGDWFIAQFGKNK